MLVSVYHRCHSKWGSFPDIPSYVVFPSAVLPLDSLQSATNVLVSAFNWACTDVMATLDVNPYAAARAFPFFTFAANYLCVHPPRPVHFLALHGPQSPIAKSISTILRKILSAQWLCLSFFSSAREVASDTPSEHSTIVTMVGLLRAFRFSADVQPDAVSYERTLRLANVDQNICIFIHPRWS